MPMRWCGEDAAAGRSDVGGGGRGGANTAARAARQRVREPGRRRTGAPAPELGSGHGEPRNDGVGGTRSRATGLAWTNSARSTASSPSRPPPPSTSPPPPSTPAPSPPPPPCRIRLPAALLPASPPFSRRISSPRRHLAPCLRRTGRWSSDPGGAAARELSGGRIQVPRHLLPPPATRGAARPLLRRRSPRREGEAVGRTWAPRPMADLLGARYE
ncbi:hypothetical protein ACP70R_004264 [Stipagrostis hirtigluma subsp. patula]